MPNSSLLYGVMSALVVVVVGGGVYVAKQHGAFDPPVSKTEATAAAAPAPAPPAPPPPPAATPPVVSAPQSAPPAPAQSARPTAAQEQLRQLVLDARQAITRGDFGSAGRALDQAERIDPRAPDVIAARRDMRDLEQKAQRHDRRLDAMVRDARAAIERRDFAAADRLIDQAEKLDAHDSSVRQVRVDLDVARQQAARADDRRVDALVAQARSAIAHHDYATADRLLDQAETIDARDRDVLQARAELNAVTRPAPGPRPR